MTDRQIMETEHIVFKYFSHIKIAKYFLKKTTPTRHLNDYEILDISTILNNCNLSHYEQQTVIFYGYKLCRPPYRGIHRDAWNSAINTIKNEFIKRGIIS